MPPMIQTCIHTRNTPSNCAPADHWGLSAASHRMPHAPLSNTLQVLVDQRWLSVTAVAKGAAVKQPTLHRYIKGEVTHPHPGILAKLARYFGCSVDALLDGSAVAGAQRAEPRYTAAEVRLVVGKVLAVTARRGIHDPDTIAQCIERGLKTVDAFRERDARDQAAAIDGVLSITLS